MCDTSKEDFTADTFTEFTESIGLEATSEELKQRKDVLNLGAAALKTNWCSHKKRKQRAELRAQKYKRMRESSRLLQEKDVGDNNSKHKIQAVEFQTKGNRTDNLEENYLESIDLGPSQGENTRKFLTKNTHNNVPRPIVSTPSPCRLEGRKLRTYDKPESGRNIPFRKYRKQRNDFEQRDSSRVILISSSSGSQSESSESTNSDTDSETSCSSNDASSCVQRIKQIIKDFETLIFPHLKYSDKFRYISRGRTTIDHRLQFICCICLSFHSKNFTKRDICDLVRRIKAAKGSIQATLFVAKRIKEVHRLLTDSKCNYQQCPKQVKEEACQTEEPKFGITSAENLPMELYLMDLREKSLQLDLMVADIQRQKLSIELEINSMERQKYLRTSEPAQKCTEGLKDSAKNNINDNNNTSDCLDKNTLENDVLKPIIRPFGGGLPTSESPGNREFAQKTSQCQVPRSVVDSRDLHFLLQLKIDGSQTCSKEWRS